MDDGYFVKVFATEDRSVLERERDVLRLLVRAAVSVPGLVGTFATPEGESAFVMTAAPGTVLDPVCGDLDMGR